MATRYKTGDWIRIEANYTEPLYKKYTFELILKLLDYKGPKSGVTGLLVYHHTDSSKVFIFKEDIGKVLSFTSIDNYLNTYKATITKLKKSEYRAYELFYG